MKIERLLSITLMLLNRRKVQAKDLAEYFAVSLRTIYRDVETLNSSGIPVISSQGYEGGFSIPDNFRMSRQLFTFEDMLSVLTTLKGVNHSLKNRDIDRAIEKITALIPEEKEDVYHRHLDSLMIDIGPWGGTGRQQDELATIQRAIGRSQLLAFDYTAMSDKTSHRLVEPHTLVLKSFHWYLLGYCRKRRDFRVFRLSRMRRLTVRDESFLRRMIDPRQYFEPENDSRPPVEIVLRFSARVRVKVEESFPPEQVVEERSGSILVTFSIPEDDWIVSMILGWGDDAEVVSPLWLRAAVQQKIISMQKKYRNLT
jgi:predicted DNA-binding transcriptional regulator YafY